MPNGRAAHRYALRAQVSVSSVSTKTHGAITNVDASSRAPISAARLATDQIEQDQHVLAARTSRPRSARSLSPYRTDRRYRRAPERHGGSWADRAREGGNVDERRVAEDNVNDVLAELDLARQQHTVHVSRAQRLKQSPGPVGGEVAWAEAATDRLTAA